MTWERIKDGTFQSLTGEMGLFATHIVHPGFVLPECIPCKVHSEGAPRNLCGMPKNASVLELKILSARKGKHAPVL